MVLLLLFAAPAHGSTALDLVHIAQQYEAAHQEDVALRRYMDALALDPLCAEAYLGLGSLRARRGDLREAERVYNVALEHLPQLREARTARAQVRRTLGATNEAIEDLLVGAENDVAALRTVAGWHGEDGHTPAQLATWRKILAVAETLQATALIKEARTMVRALVIVVGPADPAAAPTQAGALRVFLSSTARRAGG
jgi:tetratricopeptide (TPR) repeat protein